jgi:hypothetical protein
MIIADKIRAKGTWVPNQAKVAALERTYEKQVVCQTEFKAVCVGSTPDSAGA